MEMGEIGKQVKIHKMIKKSENIKCAFQMTHYTCSFYQKYKEACCSSFYDISKDNGLDPFEFYSEEELLAKSETIFLYTDNNHIIGAVEISGNEIEHIFINNLSKRQGYGEQILNFSIDHIFKNNYSEVVLFVADSNEPAKSFYFKHGFVIEQTSFEEW